MSLGLVIAGCVTACVPGHAEVTVSGQVHYFDRTIPPAGDYRPAQEAVVEVEGDWFWRLSDPRTQTDVNGRYSLSVDDPPGWWGDYDDVDIEVYAETPDLIQVFEHIFAWWPYHAISHELDDVDDGDSVVIDLWIGGPLNNVADTPYRTPGETANAFLVQQEMLAAYLTLRQMGFPESDFDETEVIVPAAGDTSYYNHLTGFINLVEGGALGTGDWTNISTDLSGYIRHSDFLTTVRHEYAHAIHDEITGWRVPAGLWIPSHHGLEMAAGSELAFTEGFAEFLPAAELGLGGRLEPTPSQVAQNALDPYAQPLAIPTADPPGGHGDWEGEVAAVFWDIHDPAGQDEFIRHPARRTVNGDEPVPQAVVDGQTWVDGLADPQLTRIRQVICHYIDLGTLVPSFPPEGIGDFLGVYQNFYPGDLHALKAIAFNRDITKPLPAEHPAHLTGGLSATLMGGSIDIDGTVVEPDAEDRPYIRLFAWHQRGAGVPTFLSVVPVAQAWNGEQARLHAKVPDAPGGARPGDALWLVISDDMLPTAYRISPAYPRLADPQHRGEDMIDLSKAEQLPAWLGAAGTAPGEAAGGESQAGDAPPERRRLRREDRPTAEQLRRQITQAREALRLQAEREELALRQERGLYKLARLTGGADLPPEPPRAMQVRPLAAGRESPIATPAEAAALQRYAAWIDGVVAGQTPPPSLAQADRILLRDHAARVARELERLGGEASRALDLRLGLRQDLDALKSAPASDTARAGAEQAVSQLEEALARLAAHEDTGRRLRRQHAALQVVVVGAPGQVAQQPAEQGYGEDFEREEIGNWLFIGDAAVEGDDGGRALRTSGFAFGVWATDELTDFALRLRYRHGTGTGDIVLRCSPTDPPEHLYHLLLANDRTALIREVHQQPTELAQGAVSLRPGHWYDVGVAVRGGSVRVAIDDQLVLAMEDGDPLPGGLLGFGSVAGEGFSFDEIHVSRLVPD